MRGRSKRTCEKNQATNVVLFMVFVNLQFSTATYYVKCLPLFYLKELIDYFLIYSGYLF